MKRKNLFKIVIIIAFAIYRAFVLMWLWNWLVPSIFGLGEITFLQSLGILFLLVVMFKWRIDYEKDLDE